MHWNKENDEIGVMFQTEAVDNIKRELLKFLASIFDPLGITSPVTLMGKDDIQRLCEVETKMG